MSNDASAYVYQNIGVDPDRSGDDASAYVYQNIGGVPAPYRVGAVVGIAGRDKVGGAYVYQNVTT